MTWETFVVCLGVCGTVFGIYNIVQSRKRTQERDSLDDGRESGRVLTEIEYIKEGINDLRRKFEQYEGRHNEQYVEVVERLTAVEKSTKQAHLRIDRGEIGEGR